MICVCARPIFTALCLSRVCVYEPCSLWKWLLRKVQLDNFIILKGSIKKITRSIAPVPPLKFTYNIQMYRSWSRPWHFYWVGYPTTLSSFWYLYFFIMNCNIWRIWSIGTGLLAAWWDFSLLATVLCCRLPYFLFVSFFLHPLVSVSCPPFNGNYKKKRIVSISFIS